MLGCEVLPHVAGVAIAHALRPKRLDRLTQELFARVAEQLLRESVYEHDPPVTRGGDDCVREAVEDRRRIEQSPIVRVMVPARHRPSSIFRVAACPGCSASVSLILPAGGRRLDE